MDITISDHSLSSLAIPSIGWFPAANSKSQTDLNISVLEIRFSSLNDDDENYQLACIERQKAIEFWLESNEISFIYAEARALPPSRIRSHKSPFPYKGSIYEQGFSFSEIQVGPNSTVLAGWTKVVPANVEECCALAKHHNTSIFLVTNGGASISRTDIMNFFNFQEYSSLNYSGLFAQLDNSIVGIIRFFGNAGVDYESVSYYYRNSRPRKPTYASMPKTY